VSLGKVGRIRFGVDIAVPKPDSGLSKITTRSQQASFGQIRLRQSHEYADKTAKLGFRD